MSRGIQKPGEFWLVFNTKNNKIKATITIIIIFHLLFIVEREGLKCRPVTLFFNMQTKNTILLT